MIVSGNESVDLQLGKAGILLWWLCIRGQKATCTSISGCLSKRSEKPDEIANCGKALDAASLRIGSLPESSTSTLPFAACLQRETYKEISRDFIVSFAFYLAISPYQSLWVPVSPCQSLSNWLGKLALVVRYRERCPVHLLNQVKEAA